VLREPSQELCPFKRHDLLLVVTVVTSAESHIVVVDVKNPVVGDGVHETMNLKSLSEGVLL